MTPRTWNPEPAVRVLRAEATHARKEQMEQERLRPQLEQAEKDLASALEEACAVDLSKVDTGELIKIERSLALASKAAKEAVSVRLKLRSERADKQAQEAPEGPEGPADTPSELTHRVFDDIRGKRWHAFAIHAPSATVERAGLPESFRQGWLVFESADEVRRVAPVPPKWEDLSIDDLRLLCHKGASAPKRTGPTDSTQNPGPRFK
jgi:hypothetical protein